MQGESEHISFNDQPRLADCYYCEMASRMPSTNGNMSDDDSYTGSELSTAGTDDPFEDFLKRYTFSFEPEYCLKLRRR